MRIPIAAVSIKDLPDERNPLKNDEECSKQKKDIGNKAKPWFCLQHFLSQFAIALIFYQSKCSFQKKRISLPRSANKPGMMSIMELRVCVENILASPKEPVMARPKDAPRTWLKKDDGIIKVLPVLFKCYSITYFLLPIVSFFVMVWKRPLGNAEYWQGSSNAAELLSHLDILESWNSKRGKNQFLSFILTC